MNVLGRLLVSISRCHSVSNNPVFHTKFRNMLSSSKPTEKFKYKTYSDNITDVLFMDNTGVYVDDSAPNPDIAEEQERVKNRVSSKKKLTPKLKATSYGDWNSTVKVIHTQYFDSRDNLERMLKSTSDQVGVDSPRCIKAKKISVDEALKKMMVTLSINMEYYLQNMCDLDADLEYKVSDNLKLDDELVKKRLKQELFYKTMCRLFGKANADDQIETDGKETLYEKSFFIRDFSILTYDGNTMTAAARRDDYYLLFFFDYS